MAIFDATTSVGGETPPVPRRLHRRQSPPGCITAAGSRDDVIELSMRGEVTPMLRIAF
jgi:hypothetical protein